MDELMAKLCKKMDNENENFGMTEDGEFLLAIDQDSDKVNGENADAKKFFEWYGLTLPPDITKGDIFSHFNN